MIFFSLSFFLFKFNYRIVIKKIPQQQEQQQRKKIRHHKSKIDFSFLLIRELIEIEVTIKKREGNREQVYYFWYILVYENKRERITIEEKTLTVEREMSDSSTTKCENANHAATDKNNNKLKNDQEDDKLLEQQEVRKKKPFMFNMELDCKYLTPYATMLCQFWQMLCQFLI